MPAGADSKVFGPRDAAGVQEELPQEIVSGESSLRNNPGWIMSDESFI